INKADERIVRFEAEETLPPPRDSASRLTLRRAECLADADLIVRLNIMGPNSSPLLEVWAGRNGSCEDPDLRTDSTKTPPACWRLYSQRNSQTEVELSIPVRRILSQDRNALETEYGDDVCNKGDLSPTLT